MRSKVVHQPKQERAPAADSAKPPMRWAVRATTRKPVHIGMLPRKETGLRCGCVCPACGTVLQAVNAGRPPEHHLQAKTLGQFFRHHTGQQRDNCLTAVARLAAFQLLIECDELDLPAPTARQSHAGPSGAIYTGTATGSRYRARVVSRHWIDDQTATLTLAGGRKILVHMRTASGVTAGQGWDAVLTIQVSDPEVAGWTPEQVLEQIRLDADFTCWEHHWQHAELENQAAAEAQRQAGLAGDALPRGLTYEGESLPGAEGVLHWVVKKLLSKISRLRVPGVSREVSATMPGGEVVTRLAEIPAAVLSIRDVRLEYSLTGLVPDVICKARDVSGQGAEMDLLIEVAVTHKVDEAKLKKIVSQGLACLELDATRFRVGGRVRLSELTGEIFTDTGNKRWLHHPHLAGVVANTRAALARKAEKIKREYEEQQARAAWVEVRPEGELTQHYLATLDGRGGTLEIAGHQWVHSDFSHELAKRGWDSATDDALAGEDGIVRCIHAIKSNAQRPSRGWSGSVFEQLTNFLETKSHQRFASLVSIAFKVYAPPLSAAERTALVNANARIKASLARRELTYARPETHDRFIAHLFPEMQKALSLPYGTRKQVEKERHQANLQLWKEQEEQRQIALVKEQERQKAQLQADLQRQIAAAGRFGWSQATGFTRDVDQLLSLGDVKAMIRKYERFSIDARVVIRSAWQARADGVRLEAWLQARAPRDDTDLATLITILRTAWLAHFR